MSSCDPAAGGWHCVAVAQAPGRGTGRSESRPGGSGGGAGGSGGGAGRDPDVVCLVSRACDPVGISARPARVRTADVAAMAAAALFLPPPRPWTLPRGRTVVGLPTYLLIDPGAWRTARATASVQGQRVTVTARPAGVRWRLAGATLDCAGPGDDRGSCAYTFDRPAPRLPVTATLTYTVTWSCAGACDTPHGRLGALPATGATALAVREIQTVQGPVPP